MIRKIAVLAACVLSCSAAQAQSYYMRSNIKPATAAAAPVYTATWSAWSACDGTSRSATMTSCKDAEQKVVANSLCGATTKTEPCSFKYTCGKPLPNLTFTNSGDGGAKHSVPDAAGWEDSAANICASRMAAESAQYGYNICYAFKRNSTTWGVGVVKGQVQNQSNSGLWVAGCTKE